MAERAGHDSPARLTVRQAAFIGVGAMVGAGIFSLLGAAGEVAGAAVWLSFVIAGCIALLQGYSFAKFGARYPSAGGLLEYVAAGFGLGLVTGVTAWLTYSANLLVTAMVAVSFGSYASTMFTDDSAVWVKIFAALLIVAMTVLNVAGSTFVARAQSVIVYVVLATLVIFAVATLLNADAALLDPSGYPSRREITSSVALTFFAFLGFGVITFTAKDLPSPSTQLPKAMFLALGIATVVYIAIALGVFGTLSVEKVVSSGPTALAVAAQPVLGQAGFWMMSVTALFSTAGATNAGLYPATGLCDRLAETGQFPPFMARRVGGRMPMGLLIMAVAGVALVLGFNLTAIASIGSAVALLIFMLVTASHLRVRSETGARLWLLILAIGTAGIAFLTFVTTTLVHEPTSAVALIVIFVLSVGLEVWWWRVRRARTPAEN